MHREPVDYYNMGDSISLLKYYTPRYSEPVLIDTYIKFVPDVLHIMSFVATRCNMREPFVNSLVLSAEVKNEDLGKINKPEWRPWIVGVGFAAYSEGCDVDPLTFFRKKPTDGPAIKSERFFQVSRKPEVLHLR